MPEEEATGVAMYGVLPLFASEAFTAGLPAYVIRSLVLATAV